MNKIYEDHGKYNLIFQIPQIIYSTLISTVIKIIFTKLSLTESNIIEIKQEKKKEKL